MLGREEQLEQRLRSWEEVLEEVAGAWGLDQTEVLGPSRRRRLSRCRAEFYLCAHREAGLSYAELGRVAGRTGPAVRQAVQWHFGEQGAASQGAKRF